MEDNKDNTFVKPKPTNRKFISQPTGDAHNRPFTDHRQFSSLSSLYKIDLEKIKEFLKSFTVNMSSDKLRPRKVDYIYDPKLESEEFSLKDKVLEVKENEGPRTKVKTTKYMFLLVFI